MPNRVDRLSLPLGQETMGHALQDINNVALTAAIHRIDSEALIVIEKPCIDQIGHGTA